MNEAEARRFLRRIGRCGPGGTSVGPGLSASEFENIEREFHFVFPPDLRLLLSLGLPQGGAFPPWRELSLRSELVGRMTWPVRGTLMDVESGAFWYPTWGPKPAGLDEAKAAAGRELAAVPRLIPLYSHRYLPAEPCEAGNPVLSVYQTEIICYGANLADYAANEFGCTGVKEKASAKRVRYWSDVVDGMGILRPNRHPKHDFS